jgi:hypothetical protein
VSDGCPTFCTSSTEWAKQSFSFLAANGVNTVH